MVSSSRREETFRMRWQPTNTLDEPEGKVSSNHDCKNDHLGHLHFFHLQLEVRKTELRKPRVEFSQGVYEMGPKSLFTSIRVFLAEL